MFYELAYVDVIILQAQVQTNYAPVHCTIFDLLDVSWDIELQNQIIWCAKNGASISNSLNDRIIINDIIVLFKELGHLGSKRILQITNIFMTVDMS